MKIDLVKLFIPNEIDKVTPFYELLEDTKGKEKTLLKIIIGALLGSIFIAGSMIQFWVMVFEHGETFYIMRSLRYGVTYWYASLLIFIVLLVLIYRIYRSLRKNYTKDYKRGILISKNDTYGSAHFQTVAEMEQTCKRYDSIKDTADDILGIDTEGKYVCMNYNRGGLNRNEAYFGAPGSGKTSAIIKTKIYQAIRRGESMIITDSKGDVYSETGNLVRSEEYEVRVLNLKPEEFQFSDGFDMFSSLKPGDPALDSKADVIATSIIHNTSINEKLEGDYFGVNEFNYIKFWIMHVATNPTCIKAGQNNLADMFLMMSSTKPSEVAVIASQYTEGPIKIAYDLFAQAKPDVQQQIVQGAGIRLSKLSNIYLQQVLKNNDIDMTAPMKRKCAYYLVISDTSDAYRFISSLFFSTMLFEQIRYYDSLPKSEKKKSIPVNYIMDEYKNTGGIQEMPTTITTVRSRKIGITMILQDKGQLDTMYGKEAASSILNACTIKGCLSTNDVETATYFKNLMDNQTVIVNNERYAESTADVVHAHGEKQISKGEGQRPLMTVGDLLTMDPDEMVYVVSGMPPLKLKKPFAEKAGELIHPFEKRAVKLGPSPCNKHIPKWFSEMKQKEQEKQARIKANLEEMERNAQKQRQESAGSSPTPLSFSDAEEMAEDVLSMQETATSQPESAISEEEKAKREVRKANNENARRRYMEVVSAAPSKPKEEKKKAEAQPKDKKGNPYDNPKYDGLL